MQDPYSSISSEFHPGSIWSASGSHPRSILEPSRVHVGFILRSSRVDPGPSEVHPGSIWGSFWHPFSNHRSSFGVHPDSIWDQARVYPASVQGPWGSIGAPLGIFQRPSGVISGSMQDLSRILHASIQGPSGLHPGYIVRQTMIHPGSIWHVTASVQGPRRIHPGSCQNTFIQASSCLHLRSIQDTSGLHAKFNGGPSKFHKKDYLLQGEQFPYPP